VYVIGVAMTKHPTPLNLSKDEHTQSSEQAVANGNAEHSRVSAGVAFGLAGAIALDTCAEILWKAGVIKTGADTGFIATLLGAIQQPFFILAMLLYIPKYFNWMYVLAKADLTFAKPITSLSYITVLIFSAIFLREQITVYKVAGLLLILWGVWQVSRTEVKTAEEGGL
jgi:drug/metabolite transporter (DMT)-like permease